MLWKGVFGWDELTPSERSRALEIARNKSSLTAEDGIDDSWTYETVISCMYEPPFCRGAPVGPCQNPECQDGKLMVIALQDNAIADELIWSDEYVQTVWEMCTKCQCIVTSSQCT